MDRALRFGKVKSKRSFVNGLEDGELLEYWESGAVGQRGRFAAGKKEGSSNPSRRTAPCSSGSNSGRTPP